ncbi:MAG: peptide-methionine (R)-S-oxide reductase MsrB [Eubacteriales bacterium]|nr:peptide-methionine (R)-S-oxide reductase MsrB [Eubacteriales bacterium]
MNHYAKKRIIYPLLCFVMFILSACGQTEQGKDVVKTAKNGKDKEVKETAKNEVRGTGKTETLYLAGGCFWGIEEYFSRLYGVTESVSGYANGNSENTSYKEIADTGHAETVRVTYEPYKIRPEEILVRYFKLIDPLSKNKQGNDVGTQYRTGIYYEDENLRPVIDRVYSYFQDEIGKPLAVEVEQLKNFVPAEDYHQDYLQKNPGGYCHIDVRSAYEPIDGRHYDKPDDKKIKEQLTPTQYDVTQKAATEEPGTSEFNGNEKRGLYVDVVTGQPLFSSSDQYDAGCGWPSFTRPITSDVLQVLEDNSLGMKRLEVKSKDGDSHLGHVFEDGPQKDGGLRYCINGASLRFIPYEEMADAGYGIYTLMVE